MNKLIKNLKYNNIFAAFGTLVLLFVFPLFMADKYFNITSAKFVFFLSASVIFCILCFFYDKCFNVRNKENEKLNLKERFLKADKTDVAYLILVILGAVTVFVSDFKSQAILGTGGRYMGYLFFLSSGLAYLFISRHNVLTEYELTSFQISMALACLLGVFQACGMDLFNLITPVAQDQKAIFISTLGNIDVFSAFLALSLPVSMYMICFKSCKSKLFLLYFLTAALGFWGLFLSNSDSGYLGIFAAFWIICLLSFKSKENLRRFFDLCLYFFFLAFLYGLFKQEGIIQREMSFISQLVTKLQISCVFVLLFFILSLIFRFVKISEKTLKAFRIIFITASVVFIAVIISCVFYFTEINKSYELGSLENYLRFNDKWGTNRGFVWRIYLEMFAGLPLSQKLFGCGQDCLSLALPNHLSNEMIEFGNYTNNAHNEYIQYLVSIGVFGLSAYIALFFSALIQLFKDKENAFLSYAVAVSIISYLVQASVNITQPIVTPLLFVFLAFSRCKKEQPHKNTAVENV